MNEKIAIVLDCGATNVRAVAIDQKGKILAHHALNNQTKSDPFYSGGLIWDVEEIWQKLCTCTQQVMQNISEKNVVAVTVTTFGVDGAPLKQNGELLYPVISWACQRTGPIMENIDRYIALERLHRINGLYPFSFNTINKLIWFKENLPEILQQMDYFAFISSIFLQRLTGKLVSETSMAGTSMLTDLKKRTFSQEIFQALGIENKFPPLVEPGSKVGTVTAEAAKQSALPQGVPVVASGHDTQFAIFGAGAAENQPVLSSGTWEILMVRTKQAEPDAQALQNMVTIEWDARPGMFNPGVQWLASGVLEWIKKMFYTAEQQHENIYQLMIEEARAARPNSVTFTPDFLNKQGAIRGVGLDTTRGEIYRAALEALAQKLKDGVDILQKVGNFKAKSLIVVGGGAKNDFWNELRAKALNLPLKILLQSETTVAGAAMFAFAGAGVYDSPETARAAFKVKTKLVEP